MGGAGANVAPALFFGEKMLSLPTIVYRSPGQHPGPLGKTYEYLGVNDEAGLEAALVDGWHQTLMDACSPPQKPRALSESASVDVPDDASPTRAELEQKAEELGVKFDGRTGDALLLSRIEEAIIKLKG